MMKALALALSLTAACTVGSGTIVGPQGSGGDDTQSDSGVTPPDGISGHITASTTWMGTVNIVGDTTIDPGVTVTVMAGAVVNIAANMSVVVLGTLDAEGTTAAKITIQPANAALHFGAADAGITVGASALDVGSSPQPGTLIMKYVNQTGGSLRVFGSGTATVTDSTFSKADGDLVQMSDTASLDFEYSSIGLTAAGDTTHCDMHFQTPVGSALTAIKVSHSSVSTSSYGIMFYSGTNADFTFDNWFMNSMTNLDPTIGSVSGDFSSGYFDVLPATISTPTTGITANTLMTAMLPACDGTNDVSCAGPHP